MQRTILVVDDDPAVHEVFVILASAEPGVRLLDGARDGRQALDRVSRSCPDALVLDVRMEPMGGLEALPLLRDACPDAVIVMFSSDPELGQGLDLGADAVFDKATDDPAHLLDEVHHLLEGRSGPVPRPRSSPEQPSAQHREARGTA